MAFVEMIDRRPNAQGLQCPIAADAEDDFLLNPHLAVPTVELPCYTFVALRVLGDIGVEHIEGDAADLHTPDLCGHRPPGEVDADGPRISLFVILKMNGQRIEVVLRIPFLLPAVGIEILPEVPLLIEQPDPHERQPEVAGRFQMVAGKYAESPRIVLQALGQSKLRREVGDLSSLDAVIGLVEPGRRGFHIRLVLLRSALDLGEVGIIPGGGVQPLLAHHAEHLDRVMMGLFP